MGENHFSSLPVALYGIVLLMCALSYPVLIWSLIRLHGKDSLLATSIGKGIKGKVSVAIYSTGILVSFFNSWISFGLYCVVAVIWFIPDTRIEKRVSNKE
jgi:uncharacterized membrane protein